MNINGFFKKFLLYVPVKTVPALSGIFFIFYLYKFFPGGQYVSYSVSLFSSLVAAQLCAGWVGNSFIYYYSGVDDRKYFISSCTAVVLLIAPVASLLAAAVSVYFSSGNYVFISVWLLCFSQILFFFLSSACQAGFFVKQQLVAVLSQCCIQICLVMFFFKFVKIDFRLALISLATGYFVAAMLMLSSMFWRFGACNPFLNGQLFKRNFKLLFQYGGALSPWILGMLVMLGSDRFAIGYYNIEFGDSYLSLKDLFAGAAGLLSMPLLMMVHPIIIRKFREGAFALNIIESASSFLIVGFSLLWITLYFVGFDFFEKITGKNIGVSRGIIFLAFMGVFLNSAAVYFQKRLEVHRKMVLLACLSMASAVISVFLAWLGGRYWGMGGVALGVLIAQALYFVLVTASLYKRMNFYRMFGVPVLVGASALLAGYGLHAGLGVFDRSLVGWEKPVFWLLGFSGVSLLALWKGVRWGEFMKAAV